MTDENDYNKKFESMTEGMAYEKMVDSLVERAEFVRLVVVHAGGIYKLARQAGLPRKTAAFMARDYFINETTPSSYFMVKGDD